MLINDAYPLSDSFQPEISYYKDTDVQMNSCIQDAYAAMSAAVREQFDVPLYVREAYRTAKEQEEKTKENSALPLKSAASRASGRSCTRPLYSAVRRMGLYKIGSRTFC